MIALMLKTLMNKRNLLFNGKDKQIQFNQNIIMIIENQILKKTFYNQTIRKTYKNLNQLNKI